MRFNNVWKIEHNGKTHYGKNKMVLSSSKLLAASLARFCYNVPPSGTEPDPINYKFKGLQYIAIGAGDSSWNNFELVSGINISGTQLTDERYRNPINYCKFIEDVSFIPDSGTSNHIESNKLREYFPEDLESKTIVVTSGTNSGFSTTVNYNEELDILNDNQPFNRIYLGDSLPSGFSQDSFSILNVPISGIRITNKVEIKTTITADAAFTLREFACFGANATSGTNSGIMFNSIRLSGTQQVAVAKNDTADFSMIFKLER